MSSEQYQCHYLVYTVMLFDINILIVVIKDTGTGYQIDKSVCRSKLPYRRIKRQITWVFD